MIFVRCEQNMMTCAALIHCPIEVRWVSGTEEAPLSGFFENWHASCF